MFYALLNLGKVSYLEVSTLSWFSFSQGIWFNSYFCLFPLVVIPTPIFHCGVPQGSTFGPLHMLPLDYIIQSYNISFLCCVDEMHLNPWKACWRHLNCIVRIPENGRWQTFTKFKLGKSGIPVIGYQFSSHYPATSNQLCSLWIRSHV